MKNLIYLFLIIFIFTCSLPSENKSDRNTKQQIIPNFFSVIISDEIIMNSYLAILETVDPEDTRPIIIIIHGGSWTGGSPEDYNWALNLISQHEYALGYSAWYNTSNKDAIYQIDNLHYQIQAIREVFPNNQIIVYGVSAGAHLAMLYATYYNDIDAVVEYAGLVYVHKHSTFLNPSYFYLVDIIKGEHDYNDVSLFERKLLFNCPVYVFHDLKDSLFSYWNIFLFTNAPSAPMVEIKAIFDGSHAQYQIGVLGWIFNNF